MKNVLAKAIASALKPANFRAATDEPTDDETGDDETGDSSDDEKQAEDDDDDPDAEGEDTTSDDDSDDDGDKKPDAAAVSSAMNAVRAEERQRCLAIFSHPNAESSPKLAAKLLVDGTSQQQAVSFLDSVEANPGKQSGNSLAERVHASQGNKKPGQDSGKSKSSTKSGNLNDRMAALNSAKQ